MTGQARGAEWHSTHFTNAQYAYIVGRIARLASIKSCELAYGMWNPNFCSADAAPNALAFAQDLRTLLNDIARRMSPEPPAHEQEP